MPRLPSAEELGRRPVPVSQRRVEVADTSAMPRALARTGAVVGELADQYQREQDANSVFEARRQLDDWERATIFDRENGAVNKLGKDAEGVPDQLAQSFDEFAGKVSESLTSERQRQAFREMASSRRGQVLDWGTKHAMREKEVYEAGQFKADLASMADRAASFPDRAAGEIAIGRQRIIGFLRGKGRSTEEIDQALKEQDSKVHSSVLGSMLNAGNGEQAAEYLKANRSSMTADAALRAEGALKEVTIRTKAQSFADDAMARGLKAEDALREAREKFSGTDEDAVVREVKTRITEQEAIRAQREKESTDQAWKIIANGGGRKAIPPDLWGSLGGTDQRQINDYLEAKWRRAKADAEGKAEEPKWGVFMALTDMARDNPEKFLDPQTLLKAEPLLSRAQMAQLVSLRTGLDKKDAKSQNILTQMKDAEAMVFADIKAAGIDTTPKEGSQKAKDLVAFRGALQERILAAQAEKSTALTPMELKAIGASLLREGVEQGSGFLGWNRTRKRGYQMEPGKTYVTKTYDEIPPAIRKELESELKGGIYGGIDKAQVERMYQRGIELGRFQP